METVLLTGGSGFVGRHLIPVFQKQGMAVRVLTRSQAKARMLEERYGCLALAGDPYDPLSLEKACRGVGAVVHLIGAVTETRLESFERVHVLSTRLVLEAATRCGVRRFLHVSALGTRPYSLCRYFRTKWQAEECVRNSSLDWTILRPSLIFGKGDHFTTRIARWAESPWASATLRILPLPGGGESRLQPVAVWDVAEACLRVLGHPDALRRTLSLAGPQVLSLREALGEILSALGLSWRTDPGASARVFARVSEALAGVLGTLLGVCLLSEKPSLGWPSLVGGSALLLHAANQERWLFLAIPWPVCYGLAYALERLFGPSLLSSSELCVLEEGSWGDASLTAKLLGLQWTPFREGIRRYLPFS
jgi:uncharacterized protein YbjT (DUF2867 family)